MKKDTRSISKTLQDLAGVDDAVLYCSAKGLAALKAGKLDGANRTLMERIDGFRSVEQLLAMSGDLTSVHGVLGKLMAAGLVESISADDDDDFPAAEEAAPAPAPPKAVEVAKQKPVETPKPKAIEAPKPKAAETPKAKAAEASKPIPDAAPKPKPVEAAKPKPVEAAPAKPKAAEVKPAPPEPEEEELDELANAKLLLQHEAEQFLGASAEKLRARIDDSRSIEEIYDLIVKIRSHVARKTGDADSDKFLDQLIAGLAGARKKAKKK
ncbi:MAG: hypothetical protein HY255_12645 [Betaproteobacteria bacterium]|nr:hypothetical protein [Betaproteobacteria bacterium]